MPPSGSTFDVGGPSTVSLLPLTLLGCEVKRLRKDTEILFSGVRCLERGARTCQPEIDAARSRVDGLNDPMDTYIYDLGFIERDTTRTSDKVLALEDEGRRLRRRLDSLKASHTLMAMDWESCFDVVIRTIGHLILEAKSVDRLVKNLVDEAISPNMKRSRIAKKAGRIWTDNLRRVIAPEALCWMLNKTS
ncbi:hypothetical protein Tco_1127486 [Tanacetum coccineum]